MASQSVRQIAKLNESNEKSGRQSQQTFLSANSCHVVWDGPSSERCKSGGDERTAPGQAPVDVGGISYLMAAVFIIGEIAGSGMLALPFSVTQTGWVGVLVVLLVGFGSAYCGMCLSRSWLIIESRYPELKSHSQKPFPDIAEKAFGSCGRWVGILALATTSLAWFFSMVQLSVYFDTLHKKATFHQPDFLTFFLGIGPILFAYGGTATLPTIQNDMKSRELFTRSVIVGYAGLITLYVLIAALGYAAAGDSVSSNILDTLKTRTPGMLPVVAEILFLVHLLTAFFVVINPFFQQMESVFHVADKFDLRRVLFRTALMGLLVLVGETVPDFVDLLGLIGSSCVAITGFILPCAMYLRLVGQTDPAGRWSAEALPVWERAILVTLIVLGVVVGATSTVMAMTNIIKHGLASSCLIST
ncbi:lysine histidine transporter-like 1 [Pollicipes pollicipes]|uniref:lysine histidine transporter-like 1 n=1 Tax=Pollicipes pollicipes TaxID=41117 RepID=UPI001884DBF2|nr:lysine histidine transporter-like 1 [Pollicipes pollicipes]